MLKAFKLKTARNTIKSRYYEQLHYLLTVMMIISDRGFLQVNLLWL